MFRNLAQLAAAVAFLCCAGITPSVAQTTTQVTLKASKKWVNTGITLTAGTAVTISSSANWSWNGGTTFVGADGDPTDDFNAFDLFEPFDFFSQARLIAYIGKDPAQMHFGDGSFFPQTSGYISIGSGQTFSAPYGGQLWLIFNDSATTGTTEPNDNEGSAIATITVGGADVVAPAIAITAPTSVYLQNQAVPAQYTCVDPGDSVASCTGPVASGGAVDTSRVGPHAFTVVATDSHGNTSSQTVGYVVTDTNSDAVVPVGGTFDPTFLGSRSLIKSFLLVNPQSTAIDVSGATIADDFYGQFHIYGSTCGATLAPHHNCSVKIYYQPSVVGVGFANLHVSTSLVTQDVPLWGIGTQVRITPASGSFNDQTVSATSAPMTFQLQNARDTVLAVSQITVSGDFALDPSTTCPATGGQIRKRKACSIVVTFTPTQDGTRTGSLIVNAGQNVDPVSVSLTGTGTDP
jgi:hypothetical protein